MSKEENPAKYSLPKKPINLKKLKEIIEIETGDVNVMKTDLSSDNEQNSHSQEAARFYEKSKRTGKLG